MLEGCCSEIRRWADFVHGRNLGVGQIYGRQVLGLSRKTVSMTTTEATHDASRIPQLDHVAAAPCSQCTLCMRGRSSHVGLLASGREGAAGRYVGR